MFEFFKRIKTLVSSEAYALIEKAEDPIKMVDQYLREMEYEIQDAEKATAKVMAEEKLTKKKLDNLVQLIESRNNQAVEALQMGKEELARKILANKLQLNEELTSLQSLYDQVQLNAVQLKESLAGMRTDYQALMIKRNTLKSRAMAAKAQTSVNLAASGKQHSPAKSGFERMEQKVMQYEAEAEVSKEMTKDSISIDLEFKKIETDNLINAELERLKGSLKGDQKI